MQVHGLSVCPSTANSPLQVCCCVPGRQETSTDCCSSGQCHVVSVCRLVILGIGVCVWLLWVSMCVVGVSLWVSLTVMRVVSSGDLFCQLVSVAIISTHLTLFRHVCHSVLIVLVLILCVVAAFHHYCHAAPVSSSVNVYYVGLLHNHMYG